jgi:alkanesulfonate monooxygenase SsuD/methylene tetrahydromethanopterin reductase-like flavin-dependent oxidoreductase (luciferase family)
MEFGILFTSHPNTEAEPYPHRGVHARVTQQILRADALGYDYAWVAEHHFSNEYGIMPDVFVYAAYLAALTRRIKIGTAVVTLPLANPLRVAENTAFLDILSEGRFALGLGSGYRKYEFDGFGVDFDKRRDIQEEALQLLMELFHNKRVDHRGNSFNFKVDGSYELFPHPLQKPHPPIFLAGATARSIGAAARMGFGLFLSSWTPFAELARQVGIYRVQLEQTPPALRGNPARGHVDVARWSMSRKPMPRPGKTAKPASCAASSISPAATLPAISERCRKMSAPVPAITTRSPATSFCTDRPRP